MKKIWHPWDKWECIVMYTGITSMPDSDAKQAYADFLKDISRFKNAISRVFDEWPISCEHFLTKDINRIAWLGQASMAIETGVPRRYRAGFMLLTNDERMIANETAGKAIIEWEERYRVKDRSVHGIVARQQRLPGDTGRSAIAADGRESCSVIQGYLFGDT